MSVQIEKSFVQQYSSNVELLLQQKGSLLMPAVRNETQASEFEYYDQVGATVAQKATGRHADTPLISTPHDRRRVGLVDYDWADLIDKQDKVRTLIDPEGAYTQNAVYAMGRAKDQEILDAFFGTAYTGKDGSTAVAFPAAQQVAVNDHTYDALSGNIGLTVSKLMVARKILLAAYNDPNGEMYVAVTAKLLMDLIQYTQVNSADYNNVKPLVEGAVTRYMGLNFIVTEMIPLDGSGYARVPVWVKQGMIMTTGMNTEIDIGPRRDKRNAQQIYVCQSIGATRMQEKMVVEIKCVA